MSTEEKAFAKALTQEENKTTTTTTAAFTQAQAPVKYNLPASVNLHKQLNIKQFKNENLHITRCIKISNTLVFTDWFNKRLIICNLGGTNVRYVPLSFPPRCITYLDSNTVAVSCTHNTDILIINISTGSVTNRINYSGKCYGISYNDNNLYIATDQSKIHVMDLTCKVIRTIPTPSGDIEDITIDKDRLVCINFGSIYCCSLDGKLIWKFKKDEFHDLHRVTTDNEGNVYATDYKTNTVVVVSDDGLHYREILSKSDGLNQPWGIYFDKKENILLVSDTRSGKVFLFDVKTN